MSQMRPDSGGLCKGGAGLEERRGQTEQLERWARLWVGRVHSPEEKRARGFRGLLRATSPGGSCHLRLAAAGLPSPPHRRHRDPNFLCSGESPRERPRFSRGSGA